MGQALRHGRRNDLVAQCIAGHERESGHALMNESKPNQQNAAVEGVREALEELIAAWDKGGSYQFCSVALPRARAALAAPPLPVGDYAQTGDMAGVSSDSSSPDVGIPAAACQSVDETRNLHKKRVDDPPKMHIPRFGDWVRGIYASETNPIRDGMYVETIRRTGRTNPGKWYRLTDGKGKFWEFEAKSTIMLSAAPPQQSPEAQDAARYRLLRLRTSGSCHHDDRWVDFHYEDKRTQPRLSLPDLNEWAATGLDAAIDSAIDAAMSQQAQGNDPRLKGEKT
jgi:hypothetical protein